MANNAEDVLKVARSQIGITSGKKYWDYVIGGGYKNGNSTPWCACFVSWVFKQAGAKCAGLPAASCTYGIYAVAKKKGRVVTSSTARPGDLVIFNFDSNWGDGEHVGIIESVGANTFVTIEGNTDSRGSANGGRVAKMVRKKSLTFAIIRPDYDKKKPVVEQLVVDGNGGPKTIRRFQEQVGSAYLDGVISGQYKPNHKYFPAITSVTFEDTGESQLVKIVQHIVGVTPDGYWGRDTSRGVNARLGFKDKDVFDKESVKALQRRLNTGRF